MNCEIVRSETLISLSEVFVGSLSLRGRRKKSDSVLNRWKICHTGPGIELL